MTTIDRYKEVEIILRPWETACYWCGLIFKKPRKVIEHVNIVYDTKNFCSKEHKLQWISYKQVLRELMP